MYEIINNVHLKVKEYKGQRVVTFKDIDMVHGRPEGTAGRNFRANKDFFIEGDYFILELTNDEIRRQFGAGKNAGKTLILLTEFGYFMIAKSLKDKLAWSIHRELVKTYFKANHMETYYNDMFAKIIYKLDKIEKRQENLEQYVKNEFSHIRKDMKEIFDDSLVKNNNVMMPAFTYIHDEIINRHNEVIRIVRNLISYHLKRKKTLPNKKSKTRKE